jgi:hypothetical protein
MQKPLTRSAQKKLGARYAAAKRARKAQISMTIPSNVIEHAIPADTSAKPLPDRISPPPKHHGEIPPERYVDRWRRHNAPAAQP